jgi:hypothetical protein
MKERPSKLEADGLNSGGGIVLKALERRERARRTRQ